MQAKCTIYLFPCMHVYLEIILLSILMFIRLSCYFATSLFGLDCKVTVLIFYYPSVQFNLFYNFFLYVQLSRPHHNPWKTQNSENEQALALVVE